MHLQRPLLRKVNLQPRHSPWLPFRTWFSVNEDRRSTKAPFKWYTYWATIKFVQSHIFDRARSLNYRVYSLPINWFGSTPPPTSRLRSHTSEHVSSQILSPHLFLSASLSQLWASNTPSRSTKKKVNLRSSLYRGCRLFRIRIYHIGALLPRLVL